MKGKFLFVLFYLFYIYFQVTCLPFKQNIITIINLYKFQREASRNDFSKRVATEERDDGEQDEGLDEKILRPAAQYSQVPVLNT